MSLTQDVANMIQAANELTTEVAGKIGQIEQQAQQQISSYIASARSENYYVNMFPNSFAKQVDEEGKLLFPISTAAATDVAEVIEFKDLPENIAATVPAKFTYSTSMLPNALHLVFKSDVDPSFWLPSNPVAGRFSGGFGHIYVVSGNMSGYGPGESGPRIQHRDRNSSSWHIDFNYDASRGTEVYLFAPFVVAGYCNEADLVQYVPTQSNWLDHNIS